MIYPAAYPLVISAAASGWVEQFQDDPESFQWILRDVPEGDPSVFFIQWFSSMHRQDRTST